MGCVPSKKRHATTRKANISESLPIVEERYGLRLSILKELKRGMTINKNRLSNSSIPLQEAYNRPELDYDCLTAEIFMRSKTSQEITEIKNILKAHFLFKEVKDWTLEDLIKQMNYYSVNKGEFIFQQAEPGYNFFIIVSGSVEILVNQKRVKVQERGDCFGELALIHNSGRRASARSITRVRLWGLGRDSFKKILSDSIKQGYKENLDFLQSIEVFKSLPQSKLEILLDSALSQRFEKNEKIFLAGELNSLMYIIKEGTVNIMKNTEKLITLEKGEYFGEISLVYNTVRNASAFAGSSCLILCLTESVLNKVFGAKIQSILYNNAIRIAFSKDVWLRGLSNHQITRILPFFKSESVADEDEWQFGLYLYIVIWGTATDCETGQVWKVFDIVNSEIFCNGEQKTIKVKTNDCVICKVERDSLEKSLGIPISACLEYNKILKNMHKILFLTFLPNWKLEELSRSVHTKSFTSSETIFSEGDDADFFYIVKSGSVEITKQGTRLSLVQKKEYFGERAFLFNEKRAASAISTEPTECWVVQKETFLNLLNEKLLNYLKKKISLQEKNFELKDFKIIEKLSTGMYSTTYLVENVKNNNFYALKRIKKDDVVENELVPRFKQEKKIHLMCSFPFISTLVRTMKDSENLVFLYEYVQGPGLGKVLESNVALPMSQTRFYASVIVLVLEYLHSLNVIHREIALSSFVLDNCGYPILTDFSTSKILENRTFTIIGLPVYLSPEVIKGQGYSFFADLWSLGVLIYELLYGIVPFGHNKDDPFEIYKQILDGHYKYPVFIKESEKPSGILEKLLQSDPLERGTAEDLKKHDWFLGTDWEELMSQGVVAEYIPAIPQRSKDKQRNLNEILNTDHNDQDFDWAGEL